MASDPFRRKKDDEPFGDLFGNFEEEFRKMQAYMANAMAEAMKQADVPKGAAQPGNPFVYGFTMRLGKDGLPHIEQFGNTRPKVGPAGPEITGEGREPITDVIEHDDKVTVTAEMPGVEKEDVQVWSTEDLLTLKVDTAQRKYHKVVALPAKVTPESTEATFKNGVLDVTIRKQQRGAPKDLGHRVNVK